LRGRVRERGRIQGDARHLSPLSVSPPQGGRERSLLVVAPWCKGPEPAAGGDLPRRRGAHQDEGEHVDAINFQLRQRDGADGLAVAAEIAGEHDRRVRRPVF
jgi:hypothetical protein